MEAFLTLTDTARCLGMNLPEATREVNRAGLKTVLYQGRKCYRREDILQWLTREFGSLAARKLEAAEKSNAEMIGADPSALLVTEMLFGRIVLPHNVGTSSKMLRTIAHEACETGAIYDEKGLLEQLILREKASPTALPCGVAMIHPLDITKLYIEHSLLMLLRPPHPLPFGEETGKLTGLFFLLLFPVANEHLHVLARLSRMLRSNEFIQDLLSAPDQEAMFELIQDRETAVLSLLK